MLMRIIDAKKSVMEIEDYRYAIQQRAQTALRNIAGKGEPSFEVKVDGKDFLLKTG